MTTEKENPITTELAKQNITEQVIAKLKKDFMPLKINNIDDREGYKKVHDARIQCRDVRITAEKICKKGREDAIKEQKAWIAKEKEVVAQISEVEQYLKKQEDAIDSQIEAQKIRAERLLKLPGRKEQIKDLEKYFAIELPDEKIMEFDDTQWTNLVFESQTKKLTEQQKVIDDENAKKLLQRTIERENELIVAGAVLYSDGLGKVYRKGNASATEQLIKECIPEGWSKIVEVFKNATIPETTEKSGLSYKPGVTDRIRPIEEKELTDEEKLWNYASTLEEVPVPEMKTEKGNETLDLAGKYLSEVLNILRK